MQVRKKIIYICLTACMLFVFSVIGYFEYQNAKPALVTISKEQAILEEQKSKENTMQTVELFYYNQKRDTDATGNIMCSEKGIVPVQRQIPTTQTPIKDTLNLLLTGAISEEERNQGISSEFPLEGVSIQSISLQGDGMLKIDLLDPQRKTVGGSCRASILFKQIQMTAQQFSEVKGIEILNQELFQP
jgi:hypothetical protein